MANVEFVYRAEILVAISFHRSPTSPTVGPMGNFANSFSCRDKITQLVKPPPDIIRQTTLTTRIN